VSQSAVHAVGPDTSAAVEGFWPHHLGQQPTLRVGDVLAALQGEFPSLTPSKLRFLDAQGLVCPHRMPSGYRHYALAHIERLRYVLRQQRDAYVPLSVIRERLAQLDQGVAYEPVSLATVSDAAGAVPLADVAALAGVDTTLVMALVTEGIVGADDAGRIDRADVRVAVACARMMDTGADVREVRALVRVAQRELESAQRASAPLRRRDDESAALAAQSARVEAAVGVFAAVVDQVGGVGE